MKRLRAVVLTTVVLAVVLVTLPVGAMPKKGTIAPSFAARDIHGKMVDLDQIVAESPDMVILYFFTRHGGEEVALRLSVLDMLYGRDKLRIIAFGVKEDEKALKKFADELDIDYYILAEDQLDANALYGPMKSLPLTFILKNDKTVVKIVRGSGETAAAILTDVAETYLMQGKPEEAATVATKAQEEGEDAARASQVRGYAFTQAGKLDEAEKEFGLIQYDVGLAKVALERGDYDKAIRLADQAGAKSGYADTVKGSALMRTGKLDEAATAFQSASRKPGADWQQSEALTGQGRLLQEQGAGADAIARYEQAVALDPFNVVALSNEAAAHRADGDLEKALEALEKAKAARDTDDPLVLAMLNQIQKELQDANDVRRGELIRKQIAGLAARYAEMKEAGTDKPADPWSTRPLVLAFLPSENRTSVFFERAGTDVVLRRELEAQVGAAGPVQVVERELLDKLLQELELSASELADQNTQLQLGKLFSAQFLGFVDFAQAGPDILMYLRLIDTETTAIAQQLMRNLKNADNVAAVAEDLAKEMIGKILADRELKGLIADAASDDAVLIGIGKKHGVTVGQKFTVLEEGEPIDIPGRGVIAYRSKPVGLLEVTAVEDDYATCKVVKLNEGLKLAREMKVKAAKK